MDLSLAHEAMFYRGDDEYLAGTVPFVDAALAAREPVLVAVPAPRLRRLRVALGRRAAGVRFVDMTSVGRNPGKIIPWVLHAFLEEHAGHPVRIIGEPIWAGRSADEYPACVQHEALINVTFAGSGLRILCPYDMKALAGDVLDAVFNQPLAEPVPAPAALDFDTPRMPEVREFVTVHATRAGLPARRARDLQLAANELATNAVTHGGGTGRLRVWRAAGQVVCEVRDHGTATARLAGRTLPGPDSISGRGLALVNYVSDLVRIHTDPHGTTVRLYLDA